MHADRHTSRWVYTMFWTLTEITGILKLNSIVKDCYAWR